MKLTLPKYILLLSVILSLYLDQFSESIPISGKGFSPRSPVSLGYEAFLTRQIFIKN
jgi:hypothetical protein